MYFMDSSFHNNKPEQAKMIDISLYQHESSLSGGSSTTTAPFPNAYSSITMEAMRETIFRMAVMQPIHIDPEAVKPPRRKNVRISRDPQSVAARHRRERISERMRTLQRMVPGGTKLDTASMLDEAVHYLKFLKKQVQLLESSRRVINGGWNHVSAGISYANA